MSTGVPEDFEPELKVINNLYAFGSNQPGRSFFDADGSGTFGFNGMLKDNEIKGESNSYDFGARMYDPRIGRWNSVDPLRKAYVAFTPYSFAGNSPIKIMDPDGNILRDADGNIIVTSSGITITAGSLITSDTRKGGTGVVTTLERKYEKVTIYTDNGVPIEAMKLVEAKVKTEYYKNGVLAGMPSYKDASHQTYDAVSDCHGYTFAADKIWINNDQVNIILENDDYTSTSKQDANIVIFKDNNTGEVVHSSKKLIADKYSSNAGVTITKENITFDEAAGDFKNTSYPDYYKKGVVDRSVDIKSGIVENGLRITNLNPTQIKEVINKSNSTNKKAQPVSVGGGIYNSPD